MWKRTAWHSLFAIPIAKWIIRFDFRTFLLLHWTASPFRHQPFLLSLSCEAEFLSRFLAESDSSMAKILISSSPFVGSSLPSLSRHGRLHTLTHRRHVATRVNFSFHELPPIHTFDSTFNFDAIVSRTEGLLYTLADAAVAVDSTVSGGAASTSADTAVQKNGGWFGFISDAMEVVLKVSLRINKTRLVFIDKFLSYERLLITLLWKRKSEMYFVCIEC